MILHLQYLVLWCTMQYLPLLRSGSSSLHPCVHLGLDGFFFLQSSMIQHSWKRKVIQYKNFINDAKIIETSYKLHCTLLIGDTCTFIFNGFATKTLVPNSRFPILFSSKIIDIILFRDINTTFNKFTSPPGFL